MLQLSPPRTGELKHDYKASEKVGQRITRSTTLVLVKGLDDNNTCAAFGKTTDTLQQIKITRVNKAQGGEGEGKREELGKEMKRIASKERGSEARCFKMSPST